MPRASPMNKNLENAGMMKQMLLTLTCASIGMAAQPCLGTPVAGIERVEPPNWWVGMKNPTLQLMVHGSGIGTAAPVLSYPGVSIERVTRTRSPNYLFIDLSIGANAQPGMLDLRFERSSGVLHYRYVLQQRAADSAARAGFGSKDAILNLVPDRFANGNPGNDDVPGYPDNMDRNGGGTRHGGDIAGIAAHLDYIAEMGFTMIWPTPLLENKQEAYSYHGYAATDLYRIDPRFGTNDEYRALVRQAGTKGIGVIQDMVPNHIGNGHWWLADLPASDWLNHGGQYVPTRHARTAISDPYASSADRKNFTQGWFAPTMPDLNQSNPLLGRYLVQNAIWWIEYAGLAGLRVDTYGYSDTAFLADWSRRILDEYPNLTLVGEEWSEQPNTVAYWLRGKANKDGYTSSMPSMMDFPLSEMLRRALVTDESLNTGLIELYAALSNDQVYPHPEQMVLFEGNHDMPRLLSVLGNDLDLYKMGLTFVATMPRTPQFYYGTEVLMQSPAKRDDAGTRRDFPGGWPGDTASAFTGTGLTPEQTEAQRFMRRLLSWRKTASAIHHGKLMHFSPDNGSYVYFRYDAEEKYMVVLNKTAVPTTLPLARFQEMLGSSRHAIDVLSGEHVGLGDTLALRPRASMILRVLP